MKQILITGTGRCGTGYIGRVLSSAGVKCSHEGIFMWPYVIKPQVLHKYSVRANHPEWEWRAESSWLAAPFLDDEFTRDKTIVHLVRHPQKVILSHLRIRNWTINNPNWKQGQRFMHEHLPTLADYTEDARKSAHFYLGWNGLIEPYTDVFHRIEDDPRILLDKLGINYTDKDLFSDTRYNHMSRRKAQFSLSELPSSLLTPLLDMVERYGYDITPGTLKEPTQKIRLPPKPESVPIVEPHSDIVVIDNPVIKAIITTIDNQPNNAEQLSVLRQEPIDQIVFVNNGSKDGTQEWLNAQQGITVVNRENLGAGPGRNAGLDVAGQFDYVLMLDGGIRPLRGGTRQFLRYLERHQEADVIGVEIPDFETDYDTAWRRWPESMTVEGHAYPNNRLAHTAYALCRAKAWDSLRWCEEGPFGEAGWGADDDEMAYQWNAAGIVVHVITCKCKQGQACSGVHPYRRASGSFRRLEKETGIWPTDFGSVYEKRVVWLEQNWPQYEPGLQWGEPWLTVVVRGTSVQQAAPIIKRAHNLLRQRSFQKPFRQYPNPYSVVLWTMGNEKLDRWAALHRLHRHYGTRARNNGQSLDKTDANAEWWTGNFRVWRGDDWRDAVRPNAHYYALTEDRGDLECIVHKYNEAHPRQPVKRPPDVRQEI